MFSLVFMSQDEQGVWIKIIALAGVVEAENK
jgi:hypothetical protein